ncbi:flavin reductase family protein [Streptomyces uncialis]|uniref:flavin reductase family protein n=1 Tax=Streptomyces uncialis TaxID=1048205 RepID=UPI00093EE135|nr:flavin reductase family protein [Streptomyces uncialis]
MVTPIRSADPGVAGDDVTDPGAFRDAMRHWATGVAVITTRSPLGPHGMTVNSVLSVSLDPPTLLISLKRGSRTQGVVERTGRFTVNVLTAGQHALADRFTRRRVFGDEEFRGLCHRPSPEGGGPELEGSAAVLGCRVTRQVEVADHVLVIARVTGVRVPSAGDLEGPLLYAGRSYRSLADREGAAGGNAGRERGTGVIAELSGPPGRG